MESEPWVVVQVSIVKDPNALYDILSGEIRPDLPNQGFRNFANICSEGGYHFKVPSLEELDARGSQRTTPVGRANTAGLPKATLGWNRKPGCSRLYTLRFSIGKSSLAPLFSCAYYSHYCSAVSCSLAGDSLKQQPCHRTRCEGVESFAAEVDYVAGCGSDAGFDFSKKGKGTS